MNKIRRRMLLASVGLLAPAVLEAQGYYANQAIHLTHGFGAGGNADVVARLVGQKLESYLKQPVIVDIKAGAGGAIATNYVAKAPADGYNIVMLTGAHTVLAALKKTLPYDPVADFAFISTVSAFPLVVAVRNDHPARTLSELLGTAKSRPGKTSFTSVGVGSTQHMVGELLGSTADVDLLHVPYRGGGAPVQAVVGGDVDVLIDTLTVATPYINAGRLRALAVTSADVWPSMPDVPPASLTLRGFEVKSWLGLAAPAGTPDAIVTTLAAYTRNALEDQALRSTLASAGSAATPCSPAEMHAMVSDEITRWHGVIKKVGIPLQS